jgi:Domain of unknown function (DUF4062)
MDTRYQVFISSTYTDLREERQAVLSALLQLNAIPAGMELFPAADENAWSLISRVIDECDYYLLLIGGRYGSLDSEGLSFTEREYDYATGKRKPVMAFLHGNPDAIPIGKSEKDPTVRKALEKFRAKVEKAKHVKYWTSAEQLAGQVALTFATFVKSYPAIGWIRGDQVASAEALTEINTLRKAYDELARALDRSRTEPPPGSDRLARGDESYGFLFRAHFQVAGEQPQDAAGRKVDLNQVHAFPCNVTWNEILRAIGPMLFDEASEQSIRKALSEWVLREKEDNLDREATKWIKQSGFKAYKGPGGKNYSGAMSQHQFGTVIVQLKALGLIEKSHRSRSVKDTNTYWRLTLFGDTQVTKLIAIQSGEVREDATAVDEGVRAAPTR